MKRECQLPMRMQFQNQDVTRMKTVSCLFSQIPQEVPRFEVYATPSFRKGRNARSAKMAKQGCPDPIKGSDPVTTQLWLGRHVHDPPSSGSPRAKVPWRWTVLINLEGQGCSNGKITLPKIILLIKTQVAPFNHCILSRVVALSLSVPDSSWSL